MQFLTFLLSAGGSWAARGKNVPLSSCSVELIIIFGFLTGYCLIIGIRLRYPLFLFGIRGEKYMINNTKADSIFPFCFGAEGYTALWVGQGWL